MAFTDPNFLHTVSDFQYWLDRLGLKVPRALCGVSLEGNGPEPTTPCPACAERS